jgi:signal transduction histidine kinase
MAKTPVHDGQLIRVLLIDDDEEDFLLTKELFADLPSKGYSLDWISDYDTGLEAVCGGAYDVYLLDYRLGARTGLDLLIEARRRACIAPVILLTGQGEYEIDRAAMQAGAADYLEKGKLDGTILDRAIRYAVLQKRGEMELEGKVQERTRELEQLNADLQKEVAERRRAEEALMEADRRKDEFLATLAHELRNPLAPIRNALEIMRLSNGDPAAITRSREMMERQVGQMVRLIDDLLDVSRITRSKLQLVTETVDLNGVVEAAIEMSRPQIEKAGLQLSVSLPSKPIKIIGDRVRLAQVLTNLLNNAAKYTESGGAVTLTVAQSDAQAVISVRDTGVGIPSDMLPRVFELFTQVNRSLNRSQGGLGIGLALVRRLVEMHGGTVEVHSKGLGFGAEFVVRLPAKSD